MRRLLPSYLIAVLALCGCAVQHDPARRQQAASLVDSLSWIDAVSGMRDAHRGVWPVDKLGTHTERFPLFQVKRCDAAGLCSWGVVDARRTLSGARYVEGGVALDVEVTLNIDRRHESSLKGEKIVVAIPSDVAALQDKRTQKKALVLQYGKVERVVISDGVSYDLCVQRFDASRKPVEECPIPYN